MFMQVTTHINQPYGDKFRTPTLLVARQLVSCPEFGAFRGGMRESASKKCHSESGGKLLSLEILNMIDHAP